MKRWFLSRGKRAEKNEPEWSLEQPLLQWAQDEWTIRDALEGTAVFGATGSGKSSGSGRAIAVSMLSAGFGALVLTAKSEELTLWEEYCRVAGRWKDLSVFGADGSYRFNFLDHELTRVGRGAGITENLANLLATVSEAAERNDGNGGRDEDGFWKRMLMQLIKNAIELLVLAKGRLVIQDLYRLVVSAPTSLDQLESPEWRSRSFFMQCAREADSREKTTIQQADFELVSDYFMLEFRSLSDRTRSVVVSSFTSLLDVLNRGVLRELFAGETNLRPEDTESGRIIVVNLPVKEFGLVGQFAQVIWKSSLQRTLERRDIRKSPRPVFLWADEAQNFLTSYDMQFQTTCRGARVATVLLTQSYSNYLVTLGGGEKARAETDSLLANCNTKIFHGNSDPVTNEWAAGLIGKRRQLFANGSSSQNSEQIARTTLGLPWSGTTSSATAGFSESFDYDIQPREFSRLRTGGPRNQGRIDAVWFQSGRTFRTSGRSWMPVTFQQAKQ